MTTASLLYRIPSLFTAFPNLVAAESTRQGGVSPAPYDSLNLGINTEDDPANVEANRSLFFAELGLSADRVASSYQVHGSQILTATAPGRYEGYDALITDQPNQFVTVTVADCTPILIYDSRTGAVAAVHAGWRGAAAEIVRQTLTAMRQAFGTEPVDCHAYVGTCIDACSFEVGAEVAAAFPENVRRYDEAVQKHFVDLKTANAQQLIASGVPAGQIEISPFSTVSDAGEYFSYRREGGKTGRMLAIIGRRS